MNIYPRIPYVSALTPYGGSVGRLYSTIIKKYEEIKYEYVGESRTLSLEFLVEHLGNMSATIDLKHNLINIGLVPCHILILGNGNVYRYPIFHTTNIKLYCQEHPWFITKRMLIKLGKWKVNYKEVWLEDDEDDEEDDE